MTLAFASRLAATPLLACIIGSCSSGTDDPYMAGPTSVNPGVSPISSSTSSSSAASSGASSVAPAVSPAGGSIDPSKRFGTPTMTGKGTSTDRYATGDVTRDGKNYFYMSNGWGPGFQSHTTEWDGTAFTVVAMEGQQGPNYEPATYPTVFCGIYSRTSKECGLPREISGLTSLRTGWSWSPADPGSEVEYNAAYDVWLGTGPGAGRDQFSGYFMVWLREPPGQQPAGSLEESDVSVANVPGVWDIWAGEVNDAPIINYVRAQGADTLSLEFDILDFIRDAQTRGYEIPGTYIRSVAVGFEIWNGPVTNLKSHDFYLDVQ